jgi:uncharacterized protein
MGSGAGKLKGTLTCPPLRRSSETMQSQRVNKIVSISSGRITASAAARQLIRQLRKLHGPIMFHLSRGCCDGSAPMCFKVGDFKLGSVDEKVGEIVGCEFWMHREPLRHWVNTRWTLDAAPGRGASFSLEAPMNQRFLIRLSLGEVTPAIPGPGGLQGGSSPGR